MVEKRQRLIDKIVKLFKLGSVDANTTESEMLLAVTKARQLMAEHAISMADLEENKGKTMTDAIRDRIKHHRAYTRAGTSLALYDSMVARAVGILTDTKSYLQHGWDQSEKRSGRIISMIFLGDEDDVAVASELFMIWLPQVRKMARRQYGGGNTWSTQHTSYAVGVGVRLRDRAKQMVQGLTPDQQQTWGLVLASKALAIKSEWEKVFPPITPERLAAHLAVKKPRKTRGVTIDNDAYYAGYRDGSDFDMNTKIIK
jgi:hypothetical protein